MDNHCLIHSSVASPVCQEGQSERSFPIFAFSSRFFLVSPIFAFSSRFFLVSPICPDFSPLFGKFFAVRDGTLPPPLTPSGYATVNNIDCALMGYAILSHLSCEALHYTSNLTNQTNLECIDFLKIPLSLDWSAQMRWDKDHKKIYPNMVKNKGMYF